MAFNRVNIRLIENGEPYDKETFNRPISDLMDEIENGNLFNQVFAPEAYIVPDIVIPTTQITLPRSSGRVQVFIDGRLVSPSFYTFIPDGTVITMTDAIEPGEEVIVWIDPLVDSEPVEAVPEAHELTGQSGNAIVLPRVATFVAIYIDGRFISPTQFSLTPASGSNTVALNFTIDADDTVVVHII